MSKSWDRVKHGNRRCRDVDAEKQHQAVDENGPVIMAVAQQRELLALFSNEPIYKSPTDKEGEANDKLEVAAEPTAPRLPDATVSGQNSIPALPRKPRPSISYHTFLRPSS